METNVLTSNLVCSGDSISPWLHTVWSFTSVTAPVCMCVCVCVYVCVCVKAIEIQSCIS